MQTPRQHVRVIHCGFFIRGATIAQPFRRPRRYHMPTTRRIVAAAAGTIALAFAATSCSTGSGRRGDRPERRHHRADAHRLDLGGLLARGPRRAVRGGDRRQDHDRQPHHERGHRREAHRERRPRHRRGLRLGPVRAGARRAGPARGARQEPHPQRGEPLPRGDGAALRRGQRLLRALRMGHDRPLLPPRPHRLRPHVVERPAEPEARARGQDHDALDRPLALDAGAQGAGPLGQHHG